MMSKDDDGTSCEAGISEEGESDFESHVQLSLEEQVARLQRLVAYLLKENEQLRQTID